MKEITVVSENRVGVLADVCEALGSVGVNIEAISAQAILDKAVIRIITNDETTAMGALEKAGLKPSASEILTVKLRNRPGELAKLARRIAASAIDIESVYIVHAGKDEFEVALKPHGQGKELAGLRRVATQNI